MLSFQVCLRSVILCLFSIINFSPSSFAQTTITPEPAALIPTNSNPYFPLSVGNYWIYRCLRGEGKIDRNIVDEVKRSITAMSYEEPYRIFTLKTTNMKYRKSPKKIIDNSTYTDYLRVNANGQIEKSSDITFPPLRSTIIISKTDYSVGDVFGYELPADPIVVTETGRYDMGNFSGFFGAYSDNIDDRARKYQGLEVVIVKEKNRIDPQQSTHELDGDIFAKGVGQVWLGNNIDEGCYLVKHKVKVSEPRL